MIDKLLTRIMGLLLIAGGLGWAWAILGLASPNDPSLFGVVWWFQYCDNMDRGGWGNMGTGLVLAALGTWFLVVPINSKTEGQKPKRVPRDHDADFS